MGRTKLIGLALVFGLGSILGCSNDKGPDGLTRAAAPSASTGSASVSATFPSSDVQSGTSSVHVWVLTGSADSEGDCNRLIGGSLDPNDPSFAQHRDAVSKDPNAPAALTNVPSGKAIVYVEAVDFGGNIDYAGCQEIAVAGSTTASVALHPAKVFDCAKQGAKDGSPCDDGKLCTVGETCKGGVCQPGTARKCPVTSDDCSGARCDETKGCVPAMADDGTVCNDHLACTSGDECESGKCVGKALDCAAEAGPCRTAIGVCSESLGGCEYSSSGKYGLPCDDGVFCTANDACDATGKCVGAPRDCNNGGCAVGTCDEANHRCNSTPIATSGTCNDGLYCTTGDTCDGSGNCVGKPVTCSSSCVSCSEANYGACSQYKPLGTTCTDGNVCTTGDACNGSGSCAPTGYATTGTVCDDHNDCTTGETCTSGYCELPTNAIDGTACGAPCMIGGTCYSGYCEFSTYASSGTSCDDGESCTTNDQCNGSGKCAGTATPTCP